MPLKENNKQKNYYVPIPFLDNMSYNIKAFKTGKKSIDNIYYSEISNPSELEGSVKEVVTGQIQKSKQLKGGFYSWKAAKVYRRIITK